MRKLKFRAWDKKNNCMFYAGSLSGVSDFYMARHEDYKNIDESFYERFLIDYEWMEATEVIDKNGKNIFEGDVIEYKGKIYRIEWSQLEWRAWSIPHGEWPTLWEFIKPEYERSLCEVIGNIYENPQYARK